jgi:excisionase family DNA binding protein
MTTKIARLSMTMQQAHEATGLSVRKLYGLIAERRLKSVTIGRRRLILVKSLEDLLNNGNAGER